MTKEYIIVNGVPILRSLIAETAKELPYDNTKSQLQATNSQDAIDEINGKIVTEILYQSDYNTLTRIGNHYELHLQADADMLNIIFNNIKHYIPGILIQNVVADYSSKSPVLLSMRPESISITKLQDWTSINNYLIAGTISWNN